MINELFPTIFLGTAYGACNIIGRLVAISSPLVARAEQPIPMLILTIYSGICAILALYLIKVN